MRKVVAATLLTALTTTLTSACGQGQDHPLVTSAETSSAAPSAPPARILILEHPGYAPIEAYTGKTADYSIIEADVIAQAGTRVGPSSGGEAPGGRPDTIYTAFRVKDVVFLRGEADTLNTLLVEGGASGDDAVTVDGGPVLPAVGSHIYAVVTKPESRRFGSATVRAAQVFPVTTSGEVFLPPWVVLDTSQVPPEARETYQAEGKQTPGRKADRGRVERALKAH